MTCDLSSVIVPTFHNRFSLDEAAEELGTIQVPTSWRPLMEETAMPRLFFDVYHATSPPCSSSALEVLVLLASLRRSLFSSDEARQAFLSCMMRGTLRILQMHQGHAEHGTACAQRPMGPSAKLMSSQPA